MSNKPIDDAEALPWPRKGDTLFDGADDWYHNACVNWLPDGWDAYALGYKRAADILVGYIVDTHRDRDTIVFPIVFNYRQYIVDDEYVKALDHAESQEEHDHALDVLLAYQDIVFRAVYWELNALVELELTSLAKSILQKKGENPRRLNRGEARPVIEAEYKISLQELPRFSEIDEVRNISNAYKHDDGFAGEHEEIVPNAGLLFGHRETRYELDWDKAHQSIQAVREFMQALPGERQQFPETRLKPEDETTIQARNTVWERLRKSGALGHILGEPVPRADGVVEFTANCQLCGKPYRHEEKEALPLLALLDQCPGSPELRQGR
jgi:hypothetical protein